MPRRRVVVGPFEVELLRSWQDIPAAICVRTNQVALIATPEKWADAARRVLAFFEEWQRETAHVPEA